MNTKGHPSGCSSLGLEQAVEVMMGILPKGILPKELNSEEELPPKYQKLLPTPTATDGSKGGRISPLKGREGGNLIEALSARLFPTPTASPWRSGEASEETHEKNSRPLNEVVAKLYPTPRADGRDNAGGANSRRSAKANGTYFGRTLNPGFVEWMMGFPPRWTELRTELTGSAVSATPSCRKSSSGSAIASSNTIEETNE